MRPSLCATNYVDLQHPVQPQTVLPDDAIASIHNTALRVIEAPGIKVLLPEAPKTFANADLRVEDRSK